MEPGPIILDRMMTEQKQGAAIGTRYPLLFTYRDTLFGNASVLEVQATSGRALCIKESEDEYWIYGINPGGMAAYGSSPDAAYTAFRKAFSHILIDLANDVGTFEAFQAAVAKLFNETNVGYESDWQHAILAVQRGEVSLEGVPIVPANSPPAHAVLDHLISWTRRAQSQARRTAP